MPTKSKGVAVILMLSGRPKSSEVDGVAILDVEGDVYLDMGPVSSKATFPDRRPPPSADCSGSVGRSDAKTYEPKLESNLRLREAATKAYLSHRPRPLRVPQPLTPPRLPTLEERRRIHLPRRTHTSSDR